MRKENIATVDPKYANDNNSLLKNSSQQMSYLVLYPLSHFILSVSVTFCSTCEVFQQSHDKMSRLDSKGGIKSCIYFYGSTNNSIWIGFLCSKTNELLNRLDPGLPKSDSCQIAHHGPESSAWVSKTMAHTIFSVSFPGAVNSLILEYSN